MYPTKKETYQDVEKTYPELMKLTLQPTPVGREAKKAIKELKEMVWHYVDSNGR